MTKKEDSDKIKIVDAGIALFLFSILAVLVHTHSTWLNHLDQSVFNVMADATTPTRTYFVEHITNLGSPIFNSIVVIFACLGLCLFRWYRDSLLVFFGFFGGSSLAFLCKLIIQRPRPSEPLQVNHGFSFPSGHAFTTTMVTLFIILLVLKLVKTNWLRVTLIVLIGGWAVLVMLSRVYLRAHYFSDVLAGALLAISFVLLLLLVQKRIK